MTDAALDLVLAAAARRRLADMVADLAQVGFENDARAVAAWLEAAAGPRLGTGHSCHDAGP